MPGADLTKALTDARDSALEPPMDEIERTSRASILVVDDDPGTRFLMRTALGHLGFEVIEAADGIEGYHRYERHRPNLAPRRPDDAAHEWVRAVPQIAQSSPLGLCADRHGDDRRRHAVDCPRL